jgi:hypothetical protein
VAGEGDYRDDVIEMLAESESELRARVADLESDRDLAMDIARAAIHHCHNLTVQLDALGERHERLQGAYRDLCARIITADGMAA